MASMYRCGQVATSNRSYQNPYLQIRQEEGIYYYQPSELPSLVSYVCLRVMMPTVIQTKVIVLPVYSSGGIPGLQSTRFSLMHANQQQHYSVYVCVLGTVLRHLGTALCSHHYGALIKQILELGLVRQFIASTQMVAQSCVTLVLFTSMDPVCTGYSNKYIQTLIHTFKKLNFI